MQNEAPPESAPEDLPPTTAPKTAKRSHKKKRAAPASGSIGRQSPLYGMKAQLKTAAMGLSIGVLMATGRFDLAARPEFMDAVETRSEKFAEAWYAVAQQDRRVALAIKQLLVGGVWVNAGLQTLAFGGMLAMFAGRVPVPPPILGYVLPEFRPFLATVPTPPGANGDQAPGAFEGDGAGAAVSDVPPSDT